MLWLVYLNNVLMIILYCVKDNQERKMLEIKSDNTENSDAKMFLLNSSKIKRSRNEVGMFVALQQHICRDHLKPTTSLLFYCLSEIIVWSFYALRFSNRKCTLYCSGSLPVRVSSLAAKICYNHSNASDAFWTNTKLKSTEKWGKNTRNISRNGEQWMVVEWTFNFYIYWTVFCSS